MPPINPSQLLKALGPLLSDDGGIKGSKEALRIASLMKDASKLVTKCVYLNILRVTQSNEALHEFINVGGWDILNKWLENAKVDSNDSLIGELLQVYINLPVNVDLLKKNSAAKTIKQLSKTEHEQIKTLSAQLVDVWTKTIRGKHNENEKDDKKLKHKDKENKDKEKIDKNDKNKEKDKLKDDKNKDKRKEETDKHKNRDKEKDSKSHHREKDKKDREKDRHKDKDKHREKEKDKSSRDKLKTSSSNSSSSDKNKHSNSSSKSGKDNPSSASKKSLSSSSATLSSDKSQEKTSSFLNDIDSKDDIQRKPKTVKQFGAKFRSTGLLDDDDDEIVEPAAKKKLDLKAGLKRAGLDSKTQELPTEKKPRLTLNMPPFSTPTMEGSSTTPPEVTHGRIKIIPAKRAAPVPEKIQESNAFMDSLQSSALSYAHGTIKRKKKVTTPPTTLAPQLFKTSSLTTTVIAPSLQTEPPPTTETDTTTPPLLSPTTAMAQKMPSAPSFYRDTLEDQPEPSDDKRKREDSPPKLELMDFVTSGMEEQKKDETMEAKEDEKEKDDIGLYDDIIENVPKRPKKTVSWAKEHRLETVFYFELDESERENVNRPKSFMEMKKEEMLQDKRAMESAKRLSNDFMVEVLPWRVPKPIDNTIVPVELGVNSKEKEIQAEREAGVLAALFFNKVPNSPIEPDPEIPGEEEDIKLIPLDGDDGSCAEYEHDYSKLNNRHDPNNMPYDPELDLPMGQGHMMNRGPPMGGGPPGPMGPNGPMGGPVGPNNMGNNMNNMNMGNNMNNMNMGNNMNNNGMSGGLNLPPQLNMLLNTLHQQAQETRDPIMSNLQGMLLNVVQNTNPQDSSMLVERILGALESFKAQIPGLSNLINSMNSNGMDGNMGGPRFMGPGPGGPGGPMGGNRHGLLGTAPPGFNNMMGSGGGGGPTGNMRPPNMQGPGGPIMGGNGPNFYMGNNRGPGGGGGHNEGHGGHHRGHMGGPPNNWRSRGRGPRGYKRNVCQHFIGKGGCKYGENCQFLHPGVNGPNS